MGFTHARGERRDQGRARGLMTCRPTWGEHDGICSRCHSNRTPEKGSRTALGATLCSNLRMEARIITGDVVLNRGSTKPLMLPRKRKSMPQPLKIAVVGTGRMGAVHALHAHELATETGDCRLVALVDSDLDCARRVAGELGSEAEVFSSISDLIRSGTSEAAIVVTPTANHRQDASQLVEAGHRVLL